MAFKKKHTHKTKQNESRADSISTVFNAGIPTAPFDCSLLKSLMFLQAIHNFHVEQPKRKRAGAQCCFYSGMVGTFFFFFPKKDIKPKLNYWENAAWLSNWFVNPRCFSLQVFLQDPTEQNFLLLKFSRKEKIFLQAIIVPNFLFLPFIYLFSLLIRTNCRR